MVAVGEASPGGWSLLVESAPHRMALVQAVVNKILALQVFSELLFGSNAQQRATLEGLDEMMLIHDGETE